MLDLKLAKELLYFTASGQRDNGFSTHCQIQVSATVTALEKHFKPQVNVVVERHAFRKRDQAPHETIAQYVAALRDVASRCGFDDKTDEMFCDQLIEHVTNPSLR